MKFDVSEVVQVTDFFKSPEEKWAKLTPSQLLMDSSFQLLIQQGSPKVIDFLGTPEKIRILISFVKFSSAVSSNPEFRHPEIPYFAHLVLAANNRPLNQVLLDSPDLFKELFSIVCLKTETCHVSQGYFAAIFRNLVSSENELRTQNLGVIASNYKQFVLPMGYIFTDSNLECLKLWLRADHPPIRETQSNCFYALLLNFANQNLHTTDEFKTETSNFRSVVHFLERNRIFFEPRFLNVRLFQETKIDKRIPDFEKITIKMIYLGFLAASKLVSQVGKITDVLLAYQPFRSHPQVLQLILDILHTINLLYGALSPDEFINVGVTRSLLDIVALFPKADVVHQRVLALLKAFYSRSSKFPPDVCELLISFLYQNITKKSAKTPSISNVFLASLVRLTFPGKLTGEQVEAVRAWAEKIELAQLPFEIQGPKVQKVEDTMTLTDAMGDQDGFNFDEIVDLKLRNSNGPCLELIPIPEDLPVSPTGPRPPVPTKLSPACRGSKALGLNESFVIVQANNTSGITIELSFTESGEVTTSADFQPEEAHPNVPLMDSYEAITRNLGS